MSLTDLPWRAKLTRRSFLGTTAVLSSFVRTSEAIAAPRPSKLVKAHLKSISSLQFGPRDEILVSTSGDKFAKIWDLKKASEPVRLAHAGTVYDAAISPDARLIATATSSREVLVFDRSGDRKFDLSGHTRRINAVEFIEPNRLASASSDKTFRVWDTSKGKLDKTIGGHGASVTALKYLPDHGLLVSGSIRGRLAFWDPLEPKKLKVVNGHEREVRRIVCSRDEKGLVTRSHDGSLGVWNVERRELVRRLKSQWKHARDIAVSPDGERIVTCKGNVLTVSTMPSGRKIRTLIGHDAPVTSLAYSNDGTRVASGDASGTIIVWELESGQVMSVLFDPKCNKAGNKGLTFEVERSGYMYSYSMPCGTPIPDNATCVCNCVPGSYRVVPTYVARNKTVTVKSTMTARMIREEKQRELEEKQREYELQQMQAQVPYMIRRMEMEYWIRNQRMMRRRMGGYGVRSSGWRRRPGGSRVSRGSTTVCVCNSIPVCQVHYVDHQNSLVRYMARCLLLHFRGREEVYLRWALAEAKNKDEDAVYFGAARFPLYETLAKCLALPMTDFRDFLKEGPAPADVTCFLESLDAVIRILTSQYLTLRSELLGEHLQQPIVGRIEMCRAEAEKVAWFTGSKLFSEKAGR